MIVKPPMLTSASRFLPKREASHPTGAEFSLLPPQNGSGNWVKIVQRLPVRIQVEADPEHPLRAGMSAVAAVDTGVYRHLPRWLAARFAD